MRSPSSPIVRGLLAALLVAGLPAGCADSDAPEPVEPEHVAPSTGTVLAGEVDPGARVGIQARDIEVRRAFELRLLDPDREPAEGTVQVEYGPLVDDPRDGLQYRPAAGTLALDGRGPRQVTLIYDGTVRPGTRHAWVRVIEPGFQQDLYASTSGRWTAYRPAESDVPRIDVVAHPGCTLRGRVVAPDGEPVAGARLEVTRQGHAASAQGRAGADDERSVRTNGRGEFAIDTELEGKVDLAAWADGVGVGRLRSVPVDRLDPAQDLVVRLGGDAVIRGIVRDQRGRPVPGVTFSAFVVEDEDDPPDPLAVGLPIGSTTSDALGLVEIRGLVHGRYYVMLDGANDLVTEDGFGYVEANTREPERHVFRVATRRVLVTLIDEDGEPLAWHPEARGESQRRLRRRDPVWRTGQELAYRIEGWDEAGGASTAWKPTPERSTWALWVGADGRYRIVLGDRERGWVSRDVEVDLESDPGTLEVTLPAPQQPATLELEVPPSLRSSFPEGLHLHAVHPEDESPVLRSRQADVTQVHVQTYPPGTYLLTISGGASYLGHGGLPSYEAIVELEAGEAHLLVLTPAHRVPD